MQVHLRSQFGVEWRGNNQHIFGLEFLWSGLIQLDIGHIAANFVHVIVREEVCFGIQRHADIVQFLVGCYATVVSVYTNGSNTQVMNVTFAMQHF